MHTRMLGKHEVGAIGLGLMTFDQTGTQPRDQLAATVRAALDAGVTLFDTADAYGPGDELGSDTQGANESLIAGLLDELGVRDRVLLATKGGHVRVGDDATWELDSSRDYLKRAVDASLTRLGVEQIALYQHHRPDPDVAYPEVLDTLKEIHASGKVEMIGLSQRRTRSRSGSARRCSATRWSACRTSSRRRSGAVAPRSTSARSSGLTFLPWSPLGGLSSAKELGDKHAAFAEIAEAHGVSPQRVTLAWELAQSRCVIPIPGAKRPESITDSAAAADLELSDEELARLNADSSAV